jgi:hypothetical protein
MPSINRGTLPQNYLDSVNTGMRLPQPEPRYMFARMAIQAQMAAGALEVNADNVRHFVKLMAASGGQEVPQELDQMAVAADLYPGAIQYVDAFGKNEGDTIKFRRDIYEGGGYSESARMVKTDVPTTTSGIALKMEEVPIVLQQYEGPYDTVNSRVAPYPITQFDAKYRANKDSLVSLTRRHLLRDYIKWLDTVIRDRFRAATNITYADGVSNVLSFTAGAGHSATLDMMLKARKALADRERGSFRNGRVIALVPTQFNVDMVQDPVYRDLSAQHAGKNPLFQYLATLNDIDIFQCTTMKTYAPGDTVPTDGNAVPAGAGNNVYEALMITPGSVGFGQADPPMVFESDDTDYQKAVKVIWRSTQAFQTVDERGIQRILFQAA